MVNTLTKLNLLVFQKILVIQNPDPYLKQDRNSDSAIVMKNVTLSWTKPESSADLVHGSNENKLEEIPKSQTEETLPTLRNISFTLPKVSNAVNIKVTKMYNKSNIYCILCYKGKTAGCLWKCGEWKIITDFQHFGAGSIVFCCRSEFLTHCLLLLFVIKCTMEFNIVFVFLQSATQILHLHQFQFYNTPNHPIMSHFHQFFWGCSEASQET